MKTKKPKPCTARRGKHRCYNGNPKHRGPHAALVRRDGTTYRVEWR